MKAIYEHLSDTYGNLRNMYKFLWKKLARDPKQCGGSKKSIIMLVTVLMLMMMMMMIMLLLMMMMMRKIMMWMLRRKRMKFEEGNVEEEDRSQDRKAPLAPISAATQSTQPLDHSLQ